MPHEVIMPALGMAQDSGLIVAWRKSAGDPVKADDVLFEVETDKSTVEVPAGADGFVNRIAYEAGDEVPVGNVIAVIGDSAEAEAPEAAPAQPDAEGTADTGDAVPEGQDVIMPALGMAQDTGVIVAWHKAPGDAVKAGDVLFEVETDKATMEVEAGHDGYLAALLAEAGEDVPVGAVIAVISAGKPETPVQRSMKATTAAKAPVTKAEPAPDPKPATAPSAAKPASAKATKTKRAVEGPILASPKARRLAAEQGLDLARLAAEGIPMPYHVADLETLRALPDTTATAAFGTTALHVTARVAQAGFVAFEDWLGESATREAVWAAFAAASLRAASGTAEPVIRVDRPVLGRAAFYVNADLAPLSSAEPAEESQPALVVRDLSGSRITGGVLGAGTSPALSVATDGDAYVLTLDFTAEQLDPDAAVTLLDGFAARLEEPLRHLL